VTHPAPVDERVFAETLNVQIWAEEIARNIMGVPDTTIETQLRVVELVRSIVLAKVHERLRLIEVESGQLRILVGDGQPQRRSDRAVENHAVIQAILSGATTYKAILRDTKLGERLSPTLTRMKKAGQIFCLGKGSSAVYSVPVLPTGGDLVAAVGKIGKGAT
jgi:hypothetical protein